VRRAPSIASGIDENSPSAIGLVKFLSQVFRIPFNQERTDSVREVAGFSHVRLAVERNNDVESF